MKRLDTTPRSRLCAGRVREESMMHEFPGLTVIVEIERSLICALKKRRGIAPLNRRNVLRGRFPWQGIEESQ